MMPRHEGSHWDRLGDQDRPLGTSDDDERGDCTMLPQLLHGDETKVWGDARYRDQTDAIKEVDPRARDMTKRRTRWKGSANETQRRKNRTKSKVRARRASLPGDQTDLRLQKGAVSRLGEERPTANMSTID